MAPPTHPPSHPPSFFPSCFCSALKAASAYGRVPRAGTTYPPGGPDEQDRPSRHCSSSPRPVRSAGATLTRDNVGCYTYVPGPYFLPPLYNINPCRGGALFFSRIPIKISINRIYYSIVVLNRFVFVFKPNILQYYSPKPIFFVFKPNI